MEQHMAPQVTLTDHKGNTFDISTFIGKRVILYFYPKDMTPGCTTEALGFQEILSELHDLNTTVFGISPDTAESHQKFCDKHRLEFSLLVDTDGTLAKAFGVINEETKDQSIVKVFRETFLVDENGIIIKHWKTVRPDIHPQEVLAYIKNI